MYVVLVLPFQIQLLPNQYFSLFGGFGFWPYLNNTILLRLFVVSCSLNLNVWNAQPMTVKFFTSFLGEQMPLVSFIAAPFKVATKISNTYIKIKKVSSENYLNALNKTRE